MIYNPEKTVKINKDYLLNFNVIARFIYENLINHQACIKITNEIELESIITRFLEGELLPKKFCAGAKELVFGNFASDILSDIFNKIKNYK